MCIIITCRIPILAIIHHQAMEKWQRFIQFTRLKIGIAHIELHLLGFIGRERHGISFFVNGQSFFVFFALEQMICIQESSMSRPSATWVIIYKLEDLGGAIGLTKIERTDCFVILRIDISLRLGINTLHAILGESGKCSAIFLVLKQHHTFVEEGFRIIVFDMLLR